MRRPPYIDFVRALVEGAQWWESVMANPGITPTTPRGLVVVTGGSGFIAGYCIAQLLNDGWRVRATLRTLKQIEDVRSAIRKIAANASAIEFAADDLNSDAGWADAVARADYVLHVASPVPTVDPKSDDELVRPARDGTLRVLKAARDGGVKRVVMTSLILGDHPRWASSRTTLHRGGLD
jgi:dihydroflavonol-4-reductase